MLQENAGLVAGFPASIGFATARALAALRCDVTLNGFAPAETIDARVTELQALKVARTGIPATRSVRDAVWPGRHLPGNCADPGDRLAPAAVDAA